MKNLQAIQKAEIKKKKIALTFDDGPDPIYTPKFLDLLRRYRARATFFVIGSKVEEHPDIVKRQINEGHEVANHTFSHPNLVTDCTREEIKVELLRSQKVIGSVIKQVPIYFRPPFLAYNEEVLAVAEEVGCKTISCSIDTEDYRGEGAESIVRNVQHKQDRGAIILMHDSGGDRYGTLQALDILLPYLNQQGYRCVTLSDLL